MHSTSLLPENKSENGAAEYYWAKYLKKKTTIYIYFLISRLLRLTLFTPPPVRPSCLLLALTPVYQRPLAAPHPTHLLVAREALSGMAQSKSASLQLLSKLNGNHVLFICGEPLVCSRKTGTAWKFEPSADPPGSAVGTRGETAQQSFTLIMWCPGGIPRLDAFFSSHLRLLFALSRRCQWYKNTN